MAQAMGFADAVLSPPHEPDRGAEELAALQATVNVLLPCWLAEQVGLVADRIDAEIPATGGKAEPFRECRCWCYWCHEVFLV